MNRRIVITAVLCGLVGSSMAPAWAAEEPEAAAETEIAEAPELESDVEYAYGTVKEVKGGQLIVTEYDYEENQPLDVAYAVDDRLQLNNAASLQEIKVGDDVDVDYVDEGGRRVAVVLTVQQPYEDELEEAIEESGEEY